MNQESGHVTPCYGIDSGLNIFSKSFFPFFRSNIGKAGATLRRCASPPWVRRDLTNLEVEMLEVCGGVDHGQDSLDSVHQVGHVRLLCQVPGQYTQYRTTIIYVLLRKL